MRLEGRALRAFFCSGSRVGCRGARDTRATTEMPEDDNYRSNPVDYHDLVCSGSRVGCTGFATAGDTPASTEVSLG